MNTTSRQNPVRRPSLPRWMIVTVSLVLISLVLLFLADRLFHPQKFQIREIEVRGEFHRVDGEQVKKAVENYLVGNYFSVSLHRLEQHVEELPWVFSAALRRQWPSTIQVEIVEVQPVARWGEDRWLNFSGELVARQGQDDDRGLPLLSGPESQKADVWESFKNWAGLFSRHGLSLNELKLDERGLWYLSLSLGALATGYEQNEGESTPHSVMMTVDKQYADSRIERFIDTLNEELVLQFPAMKSVDLRYPNGFAINWNSGAALEQNLVGNQ